MKFGGWFMVQFVQEPGEILAREFPLERLGDGFVMTLKGQQAFLHSGQRRKIVWRECLALDNREVDLDLIEPTGVDGAVAEHQIRVAALQAGHASQTSVRRAIAHDPEDTARVGVGRLGHDLVYQAVEGSDTGASLATPERHACSASSEVLQRVSVTPCSRGSSHAKALTVTTI